MFLHLFALPVLCAMVLPVTAKNRIIGGDYVADRVNFYYQVSLRVKNKHLCGGSILSETAIITAAHCTFINNQRGYLFPTNILTVVVGTLQLNDTNTSLPVVELIPHQDYNNVTLVNDISIWKLGQKIKFSKYVRNIAISEDTPPMGAWCRVSGWGKKHPQQISTDAMLSDYLMYADLKIRDKAHCKRVYKTIINIGQNMICASATNKDSCQGDSGGPLVCDDKLAGIVSFGYGCGEIYYMGIYTNVAGYVGWIEKNASLDRFFGNQLLLFSILFLLYYRLQ